MDRELRRIAISNCVCAFNDFSKSGQKYIKGRWNVLMWTDLGNGSPFKFINKTKSI